MEIKIVKKFLKQFPTWQKEMTEYSMKLREIAQDIDEFHKAATIANVAGSSVGIAGGALTIAGLIASPFTFGTSLVLTGVGIGVGVVGGVTNIAANVTDASAQKNKQKEVEEIFNKYQKSSKLMSDLLNQVCCVIQSWIQCRVEDIPETIFKSTAETFMKSLITITVVTSAVTKNTLKTFKAVSGILSGLLIIWDIYSVVKDATELYNGNKTDISEKIHEIAENIEEEIKMPAEVYEKLQKHLNLK
uniref:apolipoprotein L3-like n=1 Tax=Pristiophorus japonicus TaxID=55135 RepID=UPI00398EEA29